MTIVPPGATLSRKLGIGEDSTLVVRHAPEDFAPHLPPGVRLRRQARGPADVVVAFYTSASALEREVDVLGRLIRQAGGLWIAWPKRSSGVDTDLTDHVVRAVALPRGLVDNKVCAVDATWTALRLVWRLDRR